MSRLLALPWLLLMLIIAPITAADDFAQAKRLLLEGQEEAAIEQIRASEGGLSVDADLLVARAYIQLGEPIAAEDILESVLAKSDDAGVRLRVNNQLAAISSQRGDYETALAYLVAANGQSVAISANDRQRLLVNLANTSLDAGDTTHLNKTMSELGAELSLGKVTHVNTLISMAALYRRVGQRQNLAATLRPQASTMLVTAQRSAMAAGMQRETSMALGLQAMLYEDEKKYTDAIKLTELALLYAQQANSLEATYRWHAQLGRLLLRTGNLADSEQSYAQALEILGEVRSDLPVTSPRLFAEQVLSVYNGYADTLLRKAASLDDATAQEALLGFVVSNLEALKVAEVEDYFARQCVAESEQDRAQLLTGVAIVYPVFLEDRTELILETSEGFKQFVIGVERAEITAIIREFRVELEDFYNLGDEYFELAEILEAWLIDPMEETLARLEVDTLVFIPDGPLRTIPMAALYDGEQFLIERYALASTPALALTRQTTANTEDSALVGGITEAVQGFDPLVFVGPELDEVSSILKEPELKDADFQLAEIEDSFASDQFSVVHFATHGVFSSDFRKSFVLTYDDKLTMARLRQALGGQQNLDMLVLSACETAAGDDRAALGLAGVAIQAGASSALASLWAISDEGTAMLIPAFYKGIFDDGLSKAESLRNAQIKLLRDPRFDHPVFWAPYILIGDWI